MEEKNHLTMEGFPFEGLIECGLFVPVASFLGSEDLVQLSLTSRLFGGTPTSSAGAASRVCRKRTASGARVDNDAVERNWSLVNETARSVLAETQTEEEKACLRMLVGQSYIRIYSELEQLRRPLSFDQLVGSGMSSVASDVGSGVIKKVFSDERESSLAMNNGMAMSSHVMSAGKHYAAFSGSEIFGEAFVGVIRPIKCLDERRLDDDDFAPWNFSYRAELRQERAERWGNNYGDVDCCMLNPWIGTCRWIDFNSNEDYQRGLERYEIADGNVVGLLLDLDKGTLAMYKNGVRVGEMKNGLCGKYCWMVHFFGGFEDEQSAYIKRGPIPVDHVV